MRLELLGTKVNSELLAEFVEEGLAGLGVLDDIDELIYYAFHEDGLNSAREAMERYNNAIEFVNAFKKKKLIPISEEDFKRWTTG